MDKVVAFLPLVLGLGVGVVTPMNKEWYATLDKAPWTPPGWVFGPVWTVLYLLMGLAARKIVLKTGWVTVPMLLFFLQLGLNLAWSPVFFGRKDPETAERILWVLLAAAMGTFVTFYRIDTSAGLLLVPYLVWLLVALSMNVWIVRNKS